MGAELIKYGRITLIPPTFDRVFKAIFVDDDLSMLASFLSSVLGIDITPIMLKILNPEMPVARVGDKQVRLDVRVSLSDGRVINVEMQSDTEKDMGKRSVLNLSRIMSGQAKRGKKYGDINPTIAINVLDFNYIEDETDYHNCYRMKNTKSGSEMPGAEVFEIHFLELPKLPTDAGDDMLDLWVKFLSAKTKKEFDMLATKKPVFRKAVQKLVRVNSSEERRYLEDMYISTQLERAAFRASCEEKGHAKGHAEGLAEGHAEGLVKGRVEGLAEGFSKGRVEQTIQIARALKAEGIDINIIVKTSGLSADAIRKL